MYKRTIIGTCFIILTSTLFFFCSKESSTEPEPTPVFDTARLQAALDSALVKCYQRGIGASAAVIIPDQDIWLGASGISSADPSEPMSTDMLFDIANQYCIFTVALILQFIEEGLLSFDDPISDWLPTYAYVDSTITIRQLLAHTSGLFDFSMHYDNPLWIFPNCDLQKAWTPEEIITTLLDVPYFSQGLDMKVSFTNYLLLNMIIEHISLSDRVAEMRSRFFTPLDLNCTFIDHYESIPANQRIAHFWRDLDGDQVLDDISGLPRTAISTIQQSIFCTAGDYARWMHAIFNEQVISQASLDLLLDFNSSSLDNPIWGLPITKHLEEGIEVWGTGGFRFGCNTKLVYLPQYNITISAFCNFENTSVSKIIPALMNTVLEMVS